MNTTTQTISPLRQRFLDDMRMRKLNPKTQSQYVRAVKQFAAFLGQSPDTATDEDLRCYQLYMVDHDFSPISINAAITGLKFFFETTVGHAELTNKMQPVPVPHKLPVVLSREEVARLIAASGNPKHQTALAVAYGAGLRASEVVALKVGDIDSQRMTLRVEQGKGSKDRFAMLSPVLLECLRTWWKTARTQGKMLNGGWLFPGLNPMDQLSTRQLNRAIHAAAEAADTAQRLATPPTYPALWIVYSAPHALAGRDERQPSRPVPGRLPVRARRYIYLIGADAGKNSVTLNRLSCRTARMEHVNRLAPV